MQPLQLAIPDFIYNNQPTVVPGGGAEIIPLANPAWFTNNGFSQTFSFTPAQHAPSSSPSHQYEQPHEESRSVPFGFDITPSAPAPRPPPLPPPVDLSVFRRDVPPPVPLYSATGFDLLGILARVATRPNPRVVLGPVDLTCAFVVVDTRRYDHPIVYCSPSFCTLTGYSASEVIGRNCRFLQAPFGHVQKGERRTHTSNEAVSHLKKCLVADKECQTSIVNYKKDGTPFINLVTVIPLPGGVSGGPHEDNEYTYHIGFQVDLTDQPNAILEKLRHGSYLVNYSAAHADFAKARQAHQTQQKHQVQAAVGRERKPNSPPPVVMSEDLVELIRDPSFMESIPLSISTVLPSSSNTANQDDSRSASANHPLHLLLLEASPDFIHVVSLKGCFLYVAPSVRRVLGYEPEEMVGKSISDYAHPDDVIPLTRELKESSATGSASEGRGAHCTNLKTETSSSTNLQQHAAIAMPRVVNLLFRARTKMRRYVWVECRGRLHIEPGKGRKAIVLSGRAKEMVRLSWADVRIAGGLARGGRVPARTEDRQTYGSTKNASWVEHEVWGMIAGHGKETMTFLSVGRGSEDVLGWSADELIGRSVRDVILDEGTSNILGSTIANMRAYQCLPPQHLHVLADARVRRVPCALKKKNGGVADVWFIIYCSGRDDDAEGGRPDTVLTGELRREAGLSISYAPLVYQIRLIKASTLAPGMGLKSVTVPWPSFYYSYQPSPDSASSSMVGPVTASSLSTTSPSTDVFQELGVSRSSWQYELQQLRFANVRLREELAVLEAAKVETVDAQESLTRPSVSVPFGSDSAVSIARNRDDDVPVPSVSRLSSFGNSGAHLGVVHSHAQQPIAQDLFPDAQHHFHQQPLLSSHVEDLLNVDLYHHTFGFTSHLIDR